MLERIGFVSTRFAGTDGVSLESAKWAQVLWGLEDISFWYGGRLDRAPDISLCIPEAYFGHPENQWIKDRIWGQQNRDPQVSQRVRNMAEYLKKPLYTFVKKFDLTLFIIENAVTIPMHIPLGIAITEFLAETRFPAIAHHHDFYWERVHFSVNAAQDYLELAFPPRDPELQHAVINQAAQEQLSWRKGISSMLIPNVLDFENPPPAPDDYAKDVRTEIGLSPDDIMVLQPTRIVPRKGIEHAIKLLEFLDDPKYKLVISHEAGDEGWEYSHMISELAREANVDIRFISDRVGEIRQYDRKGRKVYTLWDIYPHADFVTYPSIYEGFGNALLEAIYFKVPVLVNRYDIFARDLQPKGFHLPLMEGFVTRSVAKEVQHILEDSGYREELTNHNYEVAKKFYSYSVLRNSLMTLITEIKGL
ncbi:MAG: glycosyltransferase [Kiritimatiellae bacterium]|nr:glycosyltransferase [Kiritimatiellia bacterium]